LITLKEALTLNSSEIENLRKELKEKIALNKHLGAYVEQLTNTELNETHAGIPIAIKDNINVKNWEITCASNILKGYISPYNATVINKLQKAGLAPFGKTNMDELAMGSSTESSCYGKTLNPVDTSKVPGVICMT